jgi:Fur family ferric uptake transcriptional regulator
MKQIHRQEKEQFKKLFKQEKVDRFDDRLRVLEVFLQIESHVTISELADTLQKSNSPYDVAFIRETLKLLCRFGFARQRRFDDGHVRYEHRHIGHHHDHMVCTRCGEIIEFHDEELEEMQIRIAARQGFHVLQHKMELYGICSECSEINDQPTPLVTAKPGDRLKIVDFSGGAEARMRLLSMGLRIGDTIEIITNQGRGQMVIALDCKRYVLGKGLARKLVAERVSETAQKEPVRLSRLQEGEGGTIVQVGGNGAIRRRILEMGITKGSEVVVEKYAPLKDPMELVVRGYHVSLRVEEADLILVNKDSCRGRDLA